MNYYESLNSADREALLLECRAEYEKYKEMKLSLDLSRGKPNAEQLDLSEGLLTMPMTKDMCFSESGVDYRNYGILDGTPECKRIFADLLSLDEANIFVGGNSSLSLMYDTLSRAMLFGNPDSERPWCREDKIKWICVAPGYDRHFKITEDLGFELLTVRMLDDGPDMDEVERLVKDKSVKGIWCVPKYSNPTGNTYSDAVVRRLVSMECAAPDFRIMSDNAYAVHDFDRNGDKLADIFALAREYGTEDRIMYFSSTSKITFPGSGVAIVAASKRNLDFLKRYTGTQTIGYDKINQMRHVHYFKNADNMYEHMLRLGEKISKKFEITLAGLEALSGLGIASWTQPRGGYFVSLDVLCGKASRVYELMKGVGVTLTQVGATFPYGRDPEDKNLRIAPTYPTDSDLALAVKLLVLSVKLSALESLSGK